MPKVKVYSTEICPYCLTLKQFLEEHNIKFEDINVSEDKEALNEMIKKSSRMEVPIVDINGEIIEGFDKEKICKLLNIKE